MNNPAYLGFSILENSKTLMYEFWYDYIRSKFQNNAKLCYLDTGSVIIQIKTKDFYKYVADGVAKWFHTSNCSADDKRPIQRNMNKTVIGLFKDKLGGRIMKKIVALKPQTYSYLMNDDKNVKKTKGTKKYIQNKDLN